MFLPDKHISFAESILGLGAFALESLARPMTVDALWRKFERQAAEYPAHQTFDNLVLALDAMFAVGLIELNDVGELLRRGVEDSECA